MENGLPLPGGGSKGGGCREGQDINPPETEYGRAIYCDEADFGLYEVAERRRGTRVPQRWWEQRGIYWNSDREKAAAQGGANEAEPEMTGLISDSELEPTTGGTTGGTGEEASLGASGSSGAEWSGAED